MMTAEHRRPLLAFLLVAAAACLILGNGLRNQVVDVLIGAGAPPPLITAIAPDMVLGHSLRDAPTLVQPQATRERSARTTAPSGPTVPAPQVSTSTTGTGRTTTAALRTSPQRPARPARTSTRGGQTAPVVTPKPSTATPDPTPAPTPAPTKGDPVPTSKPPRTLVPSRPGFLPADPVTTDSGGHTGRPGHWNHGPAKGEHASGGTKAPVGRHHGWGHGQVGTSATTVKNAAPGSQRGPGRHGSGSRPGRDHTPPVRRHLQAQDRFAPHHLGTRHSSTRHFATKKDSATRGAPARNVPGKSVTRGNRDGEHRSGPRGAARADRQDRHQDHARGRGHAGRSGHRG